MSTTTSDTAKQVSDTIFSQLGGNLFARMTGAKQFVYGTDKDRNDYLQFSLPGTANFVKDRINCVRITLMPSDTYKVEFRRKHTLREIEKVIREQGAGAVVGFDTVETAEDIYFDSLTDCFTRVTGLETRMPRFSTR